MYNLSYICLFYQRTNLSAIKKANVNFFVLIASFDYFTETV